MDLTNSGVLSNNICSQHLYIHRFHLLIISSPKQKFVLGGEKKKKGRKKSRKMPLIFIFIFRFLGIKITEKEG